MDINEFKNNFPGTSLPKMIEFIWNGKDVLYEDAVNVGVFERLSKKEKPRAPQFKKQIKKFVKWGAIKIVKDRIIVIDDFVPKSQR